MEITGKTLKIGNIFLSMNSAMLKIGVRISKAVRDALTSLFRIRISSLGFSIWVVFCRVEKVVGGTKR